MKFTTSAVFIASVFSAFASAQSPPAACTTSISAPFLADCQTALNGLSTTGTCGTQISSLVLNSALSCSIRTWSKNGNAACLNRAQVIAALNNIISSCQFTGSGPNTRVEGTQELVAGTGDFVGFQQSGCTSECFSPIA